MECDYEIRDKGLILKIFATADLHLGMKFSTFDEAGVELAEARYTALEKCVEAANDEHCDLFIIAGDLFDRQNVSSADITKAAAILSRFAGSALLVLPGNHDFYTGIDGKPWGEFLLAMEVASAPVVLLSNARPYDLDRFDIPATVFPAPCTDKHSTVDNISWAENVDATAGEAGAAATGVGEAGAAGATGKRLRIGVVHGSLEGHSIDREGRYYPMSEAQLENLPADFWIIGHTHRPFPEEDTVAPKFFIPGTPEPDGFDCRHTGGAWIINCTDRRVESYSRVETGTYRFYEEELEIRAVTEIAVSRPEPVNTLLALKLTGALSKEEYRKLPEVLDDLAGRFFYLRVNRENLDELVNSETVETEFPSGSFPARLIGSLLAEGDQEAAQIAYRLFQESEA